MTHQLKPGTYTVIVYSPHQETWYGENGNKLYFKDSVGLSHCDGPANGGHEEWFNENGKIILRKWDKGFESIWNYDNNGNLIYFKDVFGGEDIWEYSEK